jgi:hypothetical protein
LRVPGVVLLLIAAVAIIGCSSNPQPTAGDGWRLVDVRRGNVGPGATVARIGDDAYLVELTVLGGGADDCGRPRFIGFEARAETLVAVIDRPPITETCLVGTNIIFDVLLERRFIPVGIMRLEISETCSNDEPGCPGNGVPIAGPAE